MNIKNEVEKEYNQLYKDYLKQFKDNQNNNIISKKSKPLSFNDFLPDSYKY